MEIGWFAFTVCITLLAIALAIMLLIWAIVRTFGKK